MRVHPLYRRFCRLSSRERKLKLLADVLEQSTCKAVRWLDEWGRTPDWVLSKLARIRRIVDRLADRAAEVPYLANEPTCEHRAEHTPLARDCPEPCKPPPKHELVRELLAMLPEHVRKIISWRFGVNGQRRLQVDEIARRLGCHENTVRNRLNRALDALSLMYKP